MEEEPGNSKKNSKTNDGFFFVFPLSFLPFNIRISRTVCERHFFDEKNSFWENWINR